ncbi:MAG: SRPBCC family protein [Desertimonas sp.]
MTRDLLSDPTPPMKTTADLVLEDATTADVFAKIALLDDYPTWMRLVHAVRRLDADDGRPAWWVELRARVGPFARSKQLRMVRVGCEPDRWVRFERVQPDDRDHANWILDVHLAPRGESTVVTMHLEYTGELWTGGVLQRVLDDEIRRGRDGLRRAVSGSDVAR